MGAILACVGPQHPQARGLALARMRAAASGRGDAHVWSGAALAVCVLAHAQEAMLAIGDEVVLAIHGRVFDADAKAPQWLTGHQLLVLWSRWGDALGAHLDGNFCLLAHELRSARTLLQTSAAGVNSVYLSRRGDAWCVAATPWQVLAGADRPRTIDTDALERHVLGEPRPDDSCFAAVQRLGALQQWVIEVDGRVRTRSCLAPSRPREDLSLEQACAALDLDLRRSLAVHAALPDTRLALSAGLDSGSLLLRLPAGSKVSAHTLAFAGPQDESPAAASLCAQRGIAHQRHPVTPADALLALRQLLAIAQAPVHAAALCNVLLAQSAQRAGCRQLLLGSGGDELFLFHASEWRQLRRRPFATSSAWRAAYQLRPQLGLSSWRGVRDLLRNASTLAGATTRLHPGLQRHLIDPSGAALERIYAACGVELGLPFYSPGLLALSRSLPLLLRIDGGHPKAILLAALRAASAPDAWQASAMRPRFLPDWLHDVNVRDFLDNSADRWSASAVGRSFLRLAERVGWCEPRSMALQDAAVRRWGATGAVRRLDSAVAFASVQSGDRES